MEIKVTELFDTEKDIETVEELLQAGSCGATSGGCEAPPKPTKETE
ncbi:hypothetical protein [Nosocomiicoccus sp. HMSC067E10]|nr:hypothetical protein [Nosocomiicoccus sp. HMSC067E10]